MGDRAGPGSRSQPRGGRRGVRSGGFFPGGCGARGISSQPPDEACGGKRKDGGGWALFADARRAALSAGGGLAVAGCNRSIQQPGFRPCGGGGSAGGLAYGAGRVREAGARRRTGAALFADGSFVPELERELARIANAEPAGSTDGLLGAGRGGGGRRPECALSGPQPARSVPVRAGHGAHPGGWLHDVAGGESPSRTGIIDSAMRAAFRRARRSGARLAAPRPQ